MITVLTRPAGLSPDSMSYTHLYRWRLVDGVRVELTFYDMVSRTPQCYPPIQAPSVQGVKRPSALLACVYSFHAVTGNFTRKGGIIMEKLN